MTACGRETCQGKSCGNFGERGCKGVNWAIPPWSTTERLTRIAEEYAKKESTK